MSNDVTFVSCAPMLSFDAESVLLIDALAERGIRADIQPWEEERDWSQSRLTIVRSTWNYHYALEEFESWLHKVESATQVLNTPALIRWNLDKHYLRELDAAGVPVVPTHYVEPGERCSLEELFERWPELIVKPVVSAGAENTIRATRDDLESAAAHVARLSDRALMIQPMMAKIRSAGERSQIYVDGELSHVIDKVPKNGDFRCQEHHGGAYAPVVPRRRDLELAKLALGVLEAVPLFARIDAVDDENGEPKLMEMELIEPDLYLRYAEEGTARLCDAIAARIQSANP